MFKVIDISLIKKLRDRTGISVIECKKALIESEGNIELAIDIMRKSGKIKALKKSVNITTEGIILTYIKNNFGIIIEINCQTDFVSRDKNFKEFSDKVLKYAFKKSIFNIDVLRKKFENEINMLISKMGENIDIRRISTLKGDTIEKYQHGTRIGVLLSAKSKNNQLMKNIAMHIAASKPEYLNIKNIPSKIINHEYEIQSAIVSKLGKRGEIAKRIIDGRMKKFFNNISLMDQLFIMDSEKTIYQLTKENEIFINNFIRFELGENIKN